MRTGWMGGCTRVKGGCTKGRQGLGIPRVGGRSTREVGVPERVGVPGGQVYHIRVNDY